MRNFYTSYRCSFCNKERSKIDLCPHMFEAKNAEDLYYRRNIMCLRCCQVDSEKTFPSLDIEFAEMERAGLIVD
jgi:hypothetical protein